jgi:Na+/H+ antiporter NhaD/arsenite permease-like protein
VSPAVLSLIALAVVVGFSLTARLNIGILAVALAWPIAVFAAGWKAEALMAVFPSSLFLTLVGVTLLFGVVQRNGTLGALAQRSARLCAGRVFLLPAVFFGFSCVIASLGPGAIAATALMAPIAMSIGHRAGVPAFLTALMVSNGGNAGNLSPISSVGLIVQAQMHKVGLQHHDWQVFFANFTAHAMVAVAAFGLFGGLALWRAPRAEVEAPPPPLTGRQWGSLAVLVVWVAGVVGFKINPGLSAFAAASLLIGAGALDDSQAFKTIPWSVIVTVCGVSVLIGVLEKTGGMDLFTTLLARVATPGTANGAMAFFTGLVSTYSSTSGVVYPAFLPAVPGFVEKLGGGDALQVALSINVGAALVDVSPLSTIGALAIAARPEGEDERVLFRRMLLWGLSMTVVGAIFCQWFIRFFAQ